MGRWITLAVLVAVFAALLTASVVRAQEDSTTVKYAENGTAPVATYTATDPEGATPITWDVMASDASTGGIDGVEDADRVDGDHFDISKEGVLTFDIGGDDDTGDMSVSPDFENPPDSNATDNTYKVVVVASDQETGGMMGYHKVTVMVTDVNEPGKVTVATSTSNGTPQYLVGAILTATASDGDITDETQTFMADRDGDVTGVTWRWYRGGTEITGAQDNTYTLLAADAGQHIRAVVYYIVAGNVDQESASLTMDYPVLAARVGANQLKFDPAAISRTISEGAKGRNVGAPVTAAGNHGTVRYTLSGTDSEQFEIDEKTGQITTDVDLDYEAAANDDDNCATQNSCSVTVTATDSTGQPTSTASENLNATVTIKITDVDEKPTITGPQTVDVPENSTDLHGSGDDYSVADEAGVTYTAMDPEGRTVNYSLAGPDASKFQISGSPPVLSFASKPDFEAKASADGDNVYEVTVRASVGGDTGERMVRVTVGNVDEGPDVSGPSTRNFAENGTAPVATYTATDPEGATSITWDVLANNASTGGIDGVEDADRVDGDHFDISKEGVLTFDIGGDDDTGDMSVSPDFENPPDSNATDNTYKVVVVASDQETDGMMGYHKVTVTVTNVNEPGKVTLVTSTSNGTPQYLVGATLTATASDGDITDETQTFAADVAGDVTGVTWRWYRGGTEITGAQGNTYQLQTADANNRIRVVVTYRVGANTNQESASLTTDYPVLAARVGANQLKFDPAAISRTISEGAKGRNVGAPVTAAGNHGTVRYTLSGTDSEQFEIDEKTGQITTDVDLDYEAAANDDDNCATQNSCSVTVTATDSTGQPTSTASENLNATVTIKITDVDEKPTITGPQTVDVPENSTDLHGSGDDYSVADEAGVTYTAMDPEGRTVNYSLTGPDASKFQISGSPPVLSFVSEPDFEAKGSADGDNVYEVTVRASIGSDTGERMVRVTVGNVDEAPVISSGPSIRGDSSVDYEENGLSNVAIYQVVGLEDGATVSWDLSGDDEGVFNISSGGVLTFESPPDYEDPADANSDNVYNVTVMAEDGTDSAMLDVSVTVTDQEPEVSMDPADIYDRDNDGTVSATELSVAISDYLSEKLGPVELSEVIAAYING